MESKPFYLSKTLWLQVLAIVAVIVPQSHAFIEANFGASAAIWAVLNMILRLATKGKLEIS